MSCDPTEASYHSFDIPPRTTPRLTKSDVCLISLLCFIGTSVWAVYSCIARYFPTVALQKGASESLVGLIFSSFPLTAIISTPIFGKIIPVAGTKFVICAGLGVTGATSALFGLLGNVQDGGTFIRLCFVVRVFQAVGDTAVNTAAYSIIGHVFQTRLSLVVGFVSTFNSIGFAVGPLFGGLLYDHGGFGLPLYVLGSILVGIMIVSGPILPKGIEAFEPDDKTARPKRSTIGFLGRPISLLLILQACVCTAGPSFLDATLEPHLKNVFSLSSSKVGMFFKLYATTQILTSPVIGQFIDKIKRDATVMLLGSIMAFIAFCLLGPVPFMRLAPSLPLSGASMVLEGLAMQAQRIPVLSALTRAAEQEGFEMDQSTRSLISALFHFGMSAGVFVGPAIGSKLYETIGFGYASGVIALLNLTVGTALFSVSVYQKI